MIRARNLRLALAAGLGLACGCSNLSNGTSCLSRLNPFRTASSCTDVCAIVDGPIIPDPGPCGLGTCAPVLPAAPVVPAVPGSPAWPAAPVPQSAPPPVSALRPIPSINHAQPMPYQP
jgi:hypothetical protein